LLQRLNRDGMTIILVTHEPDVAAFARRILTFRDGRLRQDEPNVSHRDAVVALAESPDEVMA